MTLGRTGLAVSAGGLGGGGFSRLGLGTGRTAAEAESLVRRALDLGVNCFDTAESYGTEEVMGRALRGVPRDRVVLSTKWSWTALDDGTPRPAEVIEPTLDASLKFLGTDHVDVYHVHGLAPARYDHALAAWVPELQRLKRKGKLRAVGVTEAFESDRGHAMLSRAVADGWPDVVMVGFNILNPSARERVLAPARAKGIGTLIMFAVRRAFSRPERLKSILDTLDASGKLGPGLDDGPDRLGFLIQPGVAASLPDAAYRFCRHEPGVSCVLFGTGDAAHLEANLRSLSAPPLPPPVLARLASTFAAVDDVSGQ